MIFLLRRENNKQHTKHIKVVFQKIEEYGFKLGSEKFKFFMKQIKYLEQIIDEKEKRPTQKGPKLPKNMPSPNNVTNLLAFLDLTNCYSIYIPKM